MQTNNVIEVVVGLVDKVTAPLAGVTRSLGQLKGLATLAAGAWTLNKFIANIAEADQVTAKLDHAFKNLGGTVGVTRQRMDEIAAAIQSTTTFSDDAVKAGEAVLLTYTKVRSEVFERTVKSAADMAAAMGTDVAGAMRMLGRALQDPQIGMMLLRRSGIALTQQQREMIKEMVKVGDVAGAQTKILDLLDQRYRGTAEAMRNTLSGAFAALQNQIGEVMEGDRGSFKGLVKAINDLSKSLEDPKMREGMDAIITLLVTLTATIAKLIMLIGVPLANAFGVMIGWFDTLGAAIADSIEDWNEWWAARLGLKYTPEQRKSQQAILEFFDPTRAEKGYETSEHALDNQSERVRARMREVGLDIKGIHEQIALGYDKAIGGGRLHKDLAGAMDEMRRLVAAYQNVELRRPITVTATRMDTGEADKNVDNILEQADRIRAGLATEREKIVKELSAAQAAIAEALALPDLPEGKRKEYEEAIARLNKQSEDATEKLRAAVEEGISIPVSLQQGQLQEAQDELRGLLKSWERETQSAREQSIAQWTEYSNKLSELLAAGPEAGGITFEQFNERLKEFAGVALDAAAAFPGAYETMIALLVQMRNEAKLTAEQFEKLDLLSEVTITVQKIDLPKPEDLMAPFRERMAQTLQSTFADAFMNIGKGWKGTVQAFLDGFKRILAEAAAMRLARFFELDKIIAGQATKGVVGKIIGAIMPPLVERPSAGAVEAGRRYDEETGPGAIAGAAARGAGGECAAQCASGVVEKVATTMSTPLKTLGSGVVQSLKLLTGGLWKFLTGTLAKLWDFIKSAITAIRAMASGGGSGGSGGIVGAIVSGIGAFFGASAGGGRVQGGKPRKVGEEGPEWIVPAGDSEVVNERQARFAGAGVLAALGAITAGLEVAAAELGSFRVPDVVVAEAPKVSVPAVGVAVPKAEPLPRRVESPVTLNFSPIYNFTTSGEASKDGKVDPRLLVYIERRDQQNKVEIMEMLRRNGFGRMTR